MQCEGVGKPVHILTLFKRDANVDTLPTYFELNNCPFLVITSLSENIEILRRSGLNERFSTSDTSDFTQRMVERR